MAHDYGWSSSVSGLIQSAFFYGYILTQIPGGWVTARIGGRKVMPAGVTLWSVATAAVPLLAGTVPGVAPAPGKGASSCHVQLPVELPAPSSHSMLLCLCGSQSPAIVLQPQQNTAASIKHCALQPIVHRQPCTVSATLEQVWQ